MKLLKHGSWEYIESDKISGCAIVGYSGNEGEIIIPNIINGKPVKCVGIGTVAQVLENARMAFLNSNTVVRVVVSEGIEIIDDHAFLGCSALKEVVLPKSLKIIGQGVFYACASLHSIELPEGLERIGENAFSKCTELNSIVIPSTTKIISSLAFALCKNLENVTLSEGVESIGVGAFIKTNLSKVRLPSTLMNLPDSEIGYFDSGVDVN